MGICIEFVAFDINESFILLLSEPVGLGKFGIGILGRGMDPVAVGDCPGIEPWPCDSDLDVLGACEGACET